MTSPRSPFASASVSLHLARGGAGLLALGSGLFLLRAGGWLGIAGAVCGFTLAVVLLRGCPMCWVVGLFETLASHASHEPARIRSGTGERP